jgi:DNA-directed RNA polymerase specialized sigma24 family protein
MSIPPASTGAPSPQPYPALAARGSVAGWPETDHSVLRSLRNGTPADQEKALQELFLAYSQPIQRYIRHHWPLLPQEDIDDITSEFTTGCLTGDKPHFVTYDSDRPESRVRLRTYLCKILNHFLINHHRRARAQSRGGNQHFESLDTTQPAAHHEIPGAVSSPSDFFNSEAYDWHWAQHILGLAFTSLETGTDVSRDSLPALKPWILADPGEATLKELAQSLGRTHNALRAQLYRLRKAWRVAVRHAVAQTVSHPDEIDDELRHLAAILSRHLPE